MSFDRASAFYMGACQILSDETQGMTPGERAVAYASLAQVEAIIALAKLVALANPATGSIADDIAAKQDALAMLSQRLADEIIEDPRQP